MSITIPGTVNWYIKRLNSTNHKAREKAIQKVKKYADSRAVEPLFKALFAGKYYFSEKEEYIDALGTLLTKKQLINRFIVELFSSDEKTRIISAEALGKLGGKSAVESLIKKLSDSIDSKTNYYVVWALDRLADKRAIEPLMSAALDSNNGRFILAIAKTLDSLGATKEKLIEAYGRVLQYQSSDDEYSSAIDALRKLGDTRFFEHEDEIKINKTNQYAYQLFNPNIRNIGDRVSAAKQLGMIGHENAIEPLIKAFVSNLGPGVSQECGNALKKIVDKEQLIELYFTILTTTSSDETFERSVEQLHSLGASKERLETECIRVLASTDGGRIYQQASETLLMLGRTKNLLLEEHASALSSTHSAISNAAHQQLFLLMGMAGKVNPKITDIELAGFKILRKMLFDKENVTRIRSMRLLNEMCSTENGWNKYREIRNSINQSDELFGQLPKDINTEVYGDTSILKASQEGDLAVVKILADRGVDLNIWNHEGRTPLMLAVENGYVEIVEFLLENKANINMKVDVGPDFISEMGERVALLFMGVPAYSPSDPDWKTALDFAQGGNQNINIVSMLLDAGAKSGNPLNL